MGLDHRPDEASREELLRLAARAEEAEDERASMEARYEEARREAEELRRRLDAIAKSSRDFTKSARATMAGQHKLENELRERLARERAGRGGAEASLRRMESLLDRLGGGVWEAEASPEAGIERFTFVSARFEKTMGYPRSRWLRSAGLWLESIHPEDRERAKEAYAKAARDGETSQIEFRVFAADGRMLWLRNLIQPVEYGGDTARLHGLVADFSARRRAEEALRESEERSRALVDATSDVLYRMSPDWREMRFLSGGGFLADTESPGRFWFGEYTPPDDHPRVEAAIEEAIRTRSVFELEHRVLREDGSLGWTLSRAVPLLTADGDIREWFGSATDITERKRAEEALRESEERFRLLFERATDAVVVHDIEGRFEHVNERMCESLGYSREELLSMSVADVEMNLVPGGFESMWAKISNTGKAVLVEGAHRRKDGSTFPVEVSIGRFDGGDGKPSMLAIARDVTARKRAEEEREEALIRERRTRRQIAFLADASRELSSFLELEDTLARAARLAVPRVAEWCVVSILDNDAGYSHRLAASFESEGGKVELRHETRPDDEVPEPVREVVRTGAPLLVEKVDEEHLEGISMGEEHLERLRSFGLESYVIVPLAARGRTFGSITFARNDPKRRFDDESLSFLGNFADRAALALENSRLFERQRHTARVLQKSLLPAELPEIPGLDLAARLRPLGEGVEVGGDFYDLFRASDGRWAVAIGDVLGKGPEAASVTSLARHTLRSEARHEGAPSSVLEALNAAMLEQKPAADDRFCTVLFGNVRPKPGGFDLEFASGGHPLPLVLRSDGSVAEAGRHGALLGIFDDPELFDSKVGVGRGDTVVFCTDGVTEARKDGELFGEERVKEAVASCVGRGADEIADCLEASLHEFSGGVLGDDAAILIIKASE